MVEPRGERLSGRKVGGIKPYPSSGSYEYRGSGHDEVTPEHCACGTLGGCDHALEARRKNPRWRETAPRPAPRKKRGD